MGASPLISPPPSPILGAKIIFSTYNQTQIFLRSCFCTSIFPSWKATTRKTHPRGYQCIWDNYILAQKYYNSNTLSIFNMGYLSMHVCLKMRFCLKMQFLNSFDITWYAKTERKWLLMRNVATLLPLKSNLSGKFQHFSAIDRRVEMQKNS